MRGVPILMYHQVVPNPHPSFRKYTVTPRAFSLQMRWLALAGYTPVDLDTLLAAPAGPGSLPRNPVVITFDDGFRSCVEYAVPVLRARGFTAVFYLVVGLMGETSQWLMAERGIEFPLMSWSDARKLESQGFVCASHTLHHPHLTDLAPERQLEELGEAKRVMEQQLRHEVRHLAYPYGSYDELTQAAAADVGYHSGCSVRIGLSGGDDDPFALHRVPITGDDSLPDFISKLRGARGMVDVLRGRKE